MSKTADRLILRPDPGDSPGSASTGGTPLRKISKVVDAHDTELPFRKPIYSRNSFKSIPCCRSCSGVRFLRDLECSRPAWAYSGTESATSFPLTTLTNRYRLSRKIIVSSFSPSVTVNTSCPIIPSYFANSDRLPQFSCLGFLS